MEETVRYNYRLRPGSNADRALDAEWDRCRWVWNQCVGRGRDLWREEGESYSYGTACAELTDWRGRKEWLAAGSQCAQQQTIREWAKAHQASFKVKGRGRPRFKAWHRAQPSMEWTTNGFVLKDGVLVVAGGIRLPVVWSRGLPSIPKTVRVYRRPDGHWYASFVVRREQERFPVGKGGIGIDWGVKTLATTTDPVFDHEGPQRGKTAAGRLAAAQRRMARRKPAQGQSASKGYGRAKKTAARCHQKVADRRLDDARKWARKVVTPHHTIAVEDFKPKFLAKSTMARKAADNAIGMYKTELVRYATTAGRNLVMVPPAYTTMTCSECGARTKRLPLNERVFACPDCGYTADRDRNAARTILAAAGYNGTDAESRRQDPPSEVRAA